MTNKTFKNDMTMMFVLHDALRRELERIADVTARAGDDPQQLLRTAAGWEIFKSYLHIHHTAEDEALWPALRQALAARPDDLALLDAMESEHATIDPLLEHVDAALADRDHGGDRLAEVVDNLATGLRGHLKHEEDDALPLIDSTATEQQLQLFGMAHTKQIGPGISQYLPWMLDSASADTTAHILGVLPEPARVAYQNEWRQAYAEWELWPPR